MQKCENAPKPIKYSEDKICKYAKSKNLKYSINPKDIFKSAKKKLEKLNSKEDSLKLPYIKL